MISHYDLARLCRDSYTDAGIAGAEKIVESSNVAYIVDGEENQKVVIFQGSNEMADWLENVDARWVGHTWGKVHRGFLRAWYNVMAGVRLEVGSTASVVLTGHSLGGAMAVLASSELYRIEEVVTFGQPRVGDAGFASQYMAKVPKVTRYVYQFDPVPWLPGYLAGYRHVCPPHWNDGQKWGSGINIIHAMKMILKLCGSWNGFLERLWHFHSINNYVGAL